MSRPLRVVIDAELDPVRSGGIAQFTLGLVAGLGRLTDGEEEFVIVVPLEHQGWLDSYLGPNQRAIPRSIPPARRFESVKRALGPLRRPAARFWQAMRRAVNGKPSRSCRLIGDDGFLASLGGDVVHFPHQGYIDCDVPTVFNPHDLQHLDMPEFLSPEDAQHRDRILRGACEQAAAVAAASTAARESLLKHYGLAAQKVHVVPCGAPTEFYPPVGEETLGRTRHGLRLPSCFAFYPAQTWPHKNHLRLLEAVAVLRDRFGTVLNVVCSGYKGAHWPLVERELERLGLADQCKFVGFVTPEEVRALYRLAEFLVFPSLYEGGGLPVLEAMSEGVPVACSDIPPLREVAGDAALFFDATSVTAIAAALQSMSTDLSLRATLTARGVQRATFFSWEKLARTYRALYRFVATRPLTREDSELLAVANGERTVSPAQGSGGGRERSPSC